MNPDLLSWLETRNKSSNSALMCGVAAVIGMLTATIVDNDYLKIGACVGGVLAARSGRSNLEIKEQQERHLLAHTQVADVQNQKGQASLYAQYFAELSAAKPQLQLPPATLMPAIEASPIKTFDWDGHGWNDCDKNPNYALVGTPGTGKSTLALNIARSIGGSILVLDPHAAPDTWGDLTVAGINGNFKEISIMHSMLIGLVRERYAKRESKSTRFHSLLVIMDECPAVSKHSDSEATYKELSQVLLMEARKVNIRGIFLTQSDRAEAFGIRGNADLKQGFKFFRLGDHAIDYARKLKNDAVTNFVTKSEYPAMFERLPSILPSPNDIGHSELPADLLELFVNVA